jgi:hypothetical protein
LQTSRKYSFLYLPWFSTMFQFMSNWMSLCRLYAGQHSFIFVAKYTCSTF